MKKLLTLLLIVISVSTFGQYTRAGVKVLGQVVVKKEVLAQVREIQRNDTVWFLAFKNQKLEWHDDFQYLPIKYNRVGAAVLRDIWLSVLKEKDGYQQSYMFGGQFLTFQVVDTKKRKECGLVWKDTYIFLSEEEINTLFKFLN